MSDITESRKTIAKAAKSPAKVKTRTKPSANPKVLTPEELKSRPTKGETKAKPATKPKGVRSSTKPTGEKTEAPAKRGRPSKYTPELAREICERISNGETLRQVCRSEHMPAAPTVRSWVLDNVNGFSEQYARARILLAEHWADETVDIADDNKNDTYVDDNGNERTNSEVVQRSRLRVDTRKWMLSKVLPKVYGDKLDVNHGVQPENPLAKLFEQVSGTPLRPKGEK